MSATVRAAKLAGTSGVRFVFQPRQLNLEPVLRTLAMGNAILLADEPTVELQLLKVFE